LIFIKKSMLKFLIQKIKEKKEAEIFEEKLSGKIPASEEDWVLINLAQKLKSLKKETPVFLPALNLEIEEKTSVSFLKPIFIFSATLAILILFLFTSTPKFSGLNKKAIAKEKEMIEKQVSFPKKTEKKVEIILKNL